jgi:hypothetical protein
MFAVRCSRFAEVRRPRPAGSLWLAVCRVLRRTPLRAALCAGDLPCPAAHALAGSTLCWLSRFTRFVPLGSLRSAAVRKGDDGNHEFHEGHEWEQGGGG